MNFKLALLFLFGFIALAVALPLEKTEENDEPAEQIIAADAENPEAPLGETETEEENDDKNEEDEDQTVDELDNDEEDQENEMTESEDPAARRPRYKGFWRATPVFKTLFYATCKRVRSWCRYRSRRRRCVKVRCCGRKCDVRRFIYCRHGRCQHHWVAHRCSRRRCHYKGRKG